MKKIILLVFLILYCNENENIIKETKNTNSKIGYLRIKIINSPYEYGLNLSNVNIRGVKELPTESKEISIFEKEPSFILQGKMNDNLEKTISLEEGNYYTELSVRDNLFFPLLISDLSAKTIYYGYESKNNKNFFSFKNDFTYSKIELANCQEKVSEFSDQCPVLKIEEGKTTEIKIVFDDDYYYFNYKATGAIWLLSALHRFPIILFVGTIIISRDVSHRTKVQE